MVCIACVAIARNLGIDGGAALYGMLILLKDKYASTIGHSEATAACIKRGTGFF